MPARGLMSPACDGVDSADLRVDAVWSQLVEALARVLHRVLVEANLLVDAVVGVDVTRWCSKATLVDEQVLDVEDARRMPFPCGAGAPGEPFVRTGSQPGASKHKS